MLTYTTDSLATIYLRVADDTNFCRGDWYPAACGIGSAPTGYAWTGVQFTAGSLPRDSNPQDGDRKSPRRLSASAPTSSCNLGPPGSNRWCHSPANPFRSTSPVSSRRRIRSNFSLLSVEIWYSSTVILSLRQPSIPQPSSRLRPMLSYATLEPITQPVAKQYVALSDDNSRGAETIRRLAEQWTAGQTDPYDRALAIEQHLRNPTFFTYTLHPPAVPRQVWPVVYFLTTSHHGYCQYFASAMGFDAPQSRNPHKTRQRLRDGHYPRRQRPPRNRRRSRARPVTSSDAHAWVEAYFPGYGWIPIRADSAVRPGQLRSVRARRVGGYQWSTAGSKNAGAQSSCRQAGQPGQIDLPGGRVRHFAQGHAGGSGRRPLQPGSGHRYRLGGAALAGVAALAERGLAPRRDPRSAVGNGQTKSGDAPCVRHQARSGSTSCRSGTGRARRRHGAGRVQRHRSVSEGSQARAPDVAAARAPRGYASTEEISRLSTSWATSAPLSSRPSTTWSIRKVVAGLSAISPRSGDAFLIGSIRWWPAIWH